MEGQPLSRQQDYEEGFQVNTFEQVRGGRARGGWDPIRITAKARGGEPVFFLTDRQTDMTECITFSHTMYAGDKYYFC